MSDLRDPQTTIEWLKIELAGMEDILNRIEPWSEEGEMSRGLRQVAFETVDKLREGRSYIIDLLDIISDYTWDDDDPEKVNLEGASETRTTQTVDSEELSAWAQAVRALNMAYADGYEFARREMGERLLDEARPPLGDCICPPGADEPDFDCPRHRR